MAVDVTTDDAEYLDRLRGWRGISAERSTFVRHAVEGVTEWDGAGPWPEIYEELLDRLTTAFLYGRTREPIKADPELRRALDRDVFGQAEIMLAPALRPLKRWHQTQFIARAALRRAQKIAQEATDDAADLVDAGQIATAAAALGDSIFDGTDWQQAVRTGIPKLDRMLHGGLPRGELTLLGAGTGQGKSLLALILAEHVARTHGTVVVSSPEMRRADMGLRLALRKSGATREQLRDRDMRALTAYHEALSDLRRLPLMLLDKGDADVFEVVRVARRANEEAPVQLLVLDYAQQLAPQAGGDTARYLEVAKVATEALSFAAETGAAVLITSQLNEQRDKQGRVTGVSFRESAITEHKSAVAAVLTLDREKRRGRLVLRKSRHGACGSIALDYSPATYDLAEGVDEE